MDGHWTRRKGEKTKVSGTIFERRINLLVDGVTGSDIHVAFVESEMNLGHGEGTVGLMGTHQAQWVSHKVIF